MNQPAETTATSDQQSNTLSIQEMESLGLQVVRGDSAAANHSLFGRVDFTRAAENDLPEIAVSFPGGSSLLPKPPEGHIRIEIKTTDNVIPFQTFTCPKSEIINTLQSKFDAMRTAYTARKTGAAGITQETRQAAQDHTQP